MVNVGISIGITSFVSQVLLELIREVVASTSLLSFFSSLLVSFMSMSTSVVGAKFSALKAFSDFVNDNFIFCNESQISPNNSDLDL